MDNCGTDTLIIPFLRKADGFSPLHEVEMELRDRAVPLILRNTPWPAYPYLPGVEFMAGWGSGELFLHYQITEDRVKAEWTQTNDPVCRDSCVEFFIADGEGKYFNFEFNPIGTGQVALGSGRKGRTLMDPEQISRIRRDCSLGTAPFAETAGPLTWSLMLGIPLSFFKPTPLAVPGGKQFSANIYKCGDDLSVPHFVTWQPVNTRKPDFHQSCFFGPVFFEPREQVFGGI